ncbi:hypothetical protein B0J17DRAFT_686227 [Rhizoctonia solani]|nr:hypothetical protein B0J17DRAFT_686227 [Rhizoctonia solani]
MLDMRSAFTVLVTTFFAVIVYASPAPQVVPCTPPAHGCIKSWHLCCPGYSCVGNDPQIGTCQVRSGSLINDWMLKHYYSAVNIIPSSIRPER